MTILIILGDKHYLKGTILKKRLDKAASLFSKKYKKIITTGGKTKYTELHSEAFVMKQYLIHTHHIPRKKILIENKALNTKENAIYTKKMISSNEDIHVVTSRNHLFRAKGIFKQIYGKHIKFISSS